MRILLSYSRLHFDPNVPPAHNPYSCTSAAILAAALYNELMRFGDVTYIDQNEAETVAGRQFDLFVGIAGNFRQIRDSIRLTGRSIFFAVNSHPNHRNRVIREFVKTNRLEKSSFSIWDIADSAAIDGALRAADHILAVGNTFVFNTYLENSVPAGKICMLNYATLPSTEPLERTRHEGESVRTFVYPTSELGLRKGLDVLYAILSDPSVESAEFKLDIIGPEPAGRYREVLHDALGRWPKKLAYHGYVHSSSESYRRLLQEADFVVSTALEEGQAGAVLDGISQGAIPVVTLNTGLDFSPVGFLTPAIGAACNAAIWRRCCDLGTAELGRHRTATRKYFDEMHADWRAALSAALARCIADGQAWPKLSIVLPVHNKAASITSLLVYLDEACTAYGNVELQVLIDGCTDDSEKHVRSFFEGRNRYPVSIMATPDLFEVKTNNIGLKAASGEYCAVIQDDNYLYDPNIFFEAVGFMEKNRRAAIVGCLAGVNFYPLGTRLVGNGQITSNEFEVYWRQDRATDPALADFFFEVDACMRGPLLFRKQFLEKHGYLDEVFAPLYQDDMDICLRAASVGHSVYCFLGDVENRALTMARWDRQRWDFFKEVLERNTRELYRRWSPGADKSGYSRFVRTAIVRYRARKKAAILLAEAAFRWGMFEERLRRVARRIRRDLARVSPRGAMFGGLRSQD